ncbi:MAG: TonB family protein [Crocinitomicaceae bacterium]|jgi:TonB family protein
MFKILVLFSSILFSGVCFAQEEVESIYYQEEVDVDDSLDNGAYFPGGMRAQQQFFSDRVTYPEEAIDSMQQGKVYVSFVVEKDGAITNVEIMRGVCPSIDRECLRLVRMMPNWVPGKMSGINVTTRCTLPFSFVLPSSGIEEEMDSKDAKAHKKKARKHRNN